jgi:hypothetical protein
MGELESWSAPVDGGSCVGVGGKDTICCFYWFDRGDDGVREP